MEDIESVIDQHTFLTLHRSLDQSVYVLFFVIPWQHTGIQLVDVKEQRHTHRYI